MKKISKALSVLCSMTTFACMLGTNPAIAMVRDDGAAAAGDIRQVTKMKEFFEEIAKKEKAAKEEAKAAEARAAAAKAKAAEAKEAAAKTKEAAAKAEAARAARAAEAEANKAITRSRQAAERAAEISKSRQAAERAELEQKVKETTAKEEAAKEALEKARGEFLEAQKENRKATRAAEEAVRAGAAERAEEATEAAARAATVENEKRAAVIKAEKMYRKCAEEARVARDKNMSYQPKDGGKTEKRVPSSLLKKPPVGDSPATDDHDSVVEKMRSPEDTLAWVKATKYDFEIALARIEEISGQDSEFGIGKIFGEMIPRFKGWISRLGELERELFSAIEVVKNKRSDVGVNARVGTLVTSISREVESISESRLECDRTAGRKIVELIYSKNGDLKYLVATRIKLTCPEVWTAGFLSLLKSHGVKELDPKGDWGPIVFYGIMDNMSDMKSPVFCALLAFAECVKQVDEEQNCGLLGNTIDLHIEMAKILDLLFNKVDKPIEGVDEFYKTMDPDGTPSKYGTKKMRFLGCWIRLNSKAVESK